MFAPTYPRLTTMTLHGKQINTFVPDEVLVALACVFCRLHLILTNGLAAAEEGVDTFASVQHIVPQFRHTADVVRVSTVCKSAVLQLRMAHQHILETFVDKYSLSMCRDVVKVQRHVVIEIIAFISAETTYDTSDGAADEGAIYVLGLSQVMFVPLVVHGRAIFRDEAVEFCTA
ncbi:hypothetical protein AURDEDRAFT_131703 [Auricularia subglabra TFB-10046 SS5]|uniref:Uncharacterized protein n=1 Tax=Auricularia subglabra (strain TFB-10046 / SS5) TaxID=717982 RepID=J0CSY2_AURST|nr:hypothetical protein AURDEDRAFT_131703 [Auricularia subglabra TFB-10046 SS5]